MQQVTAALGGRLAFGGDYNPEQWPESVWAQDVALMRKAGVNLVTVAVFSWALIEVQPGRYEFGWLDRVLDLLHGGGVAVDLATATASPPPWFTANHPETRLVDEQGLPRSFGARQGFCPSSPVYRDAAAALAGRMAERYAEHPAVVLWHINNEYGCQNWHCYCDVSAEAFRRWLQQRYDDLDALNDAWGTSFWSQRYTEWAQIPAPRRVAYNTFANPSMRLDWWRFSSDELLACYRAEAAAVRRSARQPLTTNFMGMRKPHDYWSWTGDLDVVSNDHYLMAEDAANYQDLAMSADLLRSLAGGRPWLLMEHSASAVNWQKRNLAKAPGEMRRNSLQHVARGSDGALFFQWRQSRAGAEKWHSALVPHAGTDTKIWREVVELGADLQRLAEIAGTRPDPAQVALVFDWSSWWAAELDSHPSVDVTVRPVVRRWHDSLWRANVAVDFARHGADLSAYRVAIVPVQYLMSDAAAAALRSFVHGGGSLVVTYFSGLVDEHDRVRLGGYPGALRDLLGVRVEEFFPLAARASVRLSRFGSGRVWSELGRAEGAEVLATYDEGPVAGSPAVTRARVGAGSAWYVGTELADDARATLLSLVLEEAGVGPVLAGLPAGVEAVRRRSPDASYLFLLNHTGEDVTAEASGTDLLTGTAANRLHLPAGGVAVLRSLDVPATGGPRRAAAPPPAPAPRR
jgi:beta-galactosidase